MKKPLKRVSKSDTIKVNSSSQVQKRTEVQKKLMIDALEKSLGIVTTACKKVGIHRSTYYEWLAIDQEFKKQVDEIADITLDFAESKLHKQIDEGNTTATIFFLKTKGKNRGYIEKSEIEFSKESVDLSGVSDEDLEKYFSEKLNNLNDDDFKV